MRRICLYVGSATSPNVARLVSNLHRMLKDRYRVDIVSGRPDELGVPATDVGVKTYDPPTLLRGAAALRRYAAENDPTALVQITDPPVHGTVVGAVAARSGIPAVYRYAGDRFYEYRVAQGPERLSALVLGSGLGRLGLALADRFIALGPTGRRRLIARGVKPEDVSVLPPTIDARPFREARPAALDLPEGRKVALFVGRVSRLKGRDTLEEAIPAVLRRRDDLQFVFVGPAERPVDVPAWCRDRVTEIGAVPPPKVPEYMQAADVLVHPSLTDGIPRVVMEALAADTLVLARDVGDVAYVTENTFRTDSEFIERLCTFEELPTDDVERFTTEALKPDYLRFFERFG